MQSKLDILTKAVEQWQKTDTPVSQAPTADKLSAIVDVSLAQEGANDDALEAAIDDYLKYSPNSARPEFYKLLYSGVNEEALLGDWIASLTNATMHTYQVGPVATLMELELVAQCNRLIGFSHNQNNQDQALTGRVCGDGVMVAGGSQANLIGMMLARHRVNRDVKTQGLAASQGKILRAYVSDQAHYSYQRAVNILGIGSDNLIAIESNAEGQISPQALQQQIETDLTNGLQPFFIGLTAGTTVVGAFDPIAPCKALADEFNLWLHVDGAWGAPVLFSAKHKHLLADSALADSVTWDAHKLMNVPITAAFILVKNSGELNEAIAGGGGDYLFHQDANSEYNLGEKSIQCGRRADALKVWLSWKAKGHLGFEKKVNDLQRLKRFCLAEIRQRDNLELIGPSVFLNLLFRYAPSLAVNESQSAELNKQICKLMVQRGGPHIDYAQYKQRTGIRLILGNDAASENGLRDLLSQIESIGNELSVT